MQADALEYSDTSRRIWTVTVTSAHPPVVLNGTLNIKNAKLSIALMRSNQYN